MNIPPVAVIAFLAVMIAAAAADPPSSSSVAAPTNLDPVAIDSSRRNPRINPQVSAFVNAVDGSLLGESMSRWSVPLCVFAAGLLPQEADFFQRRIAAVASQAGIPLDSSGCKANFVVVVTPEPEVFLKDWSAEAPKFFNLERGYGGLRRFIQTDRAVRVWHNACTAPAALARNYRLSVRWDCNVGSPGSRLNRAVRSIYSVMVVVDLRKIEGLTWGQVADYVAMVGLAKLRADADTGAVPTVLSLFKDDDEERAQALTVWDQAFLKSLYATPDGSVTEYTQVKLRMTEELAR